jgi:hypothetical protein
MSLIVYDCETRKSVMKHGETAQPGIDYAASWGDKVGMGISVVCAFVFGTGFRIFMEDNLAELKALAADPLNLMVGWNSDAFDEPLLAAHDIPIANGYDLMRTVSTAAGVARMKLSDACLANGIAAKADGAGALAPILWQQRRYGQLTDYCLSDVARTVKLLELALHGRLRMPPSFTAITVDTSRLIRFM